MAQQDAGHDEWVNAWAETQAAPKAEPFALALIPPPDAPISPDQLMRDIAEIERVRDTLAAQPAPVFAKGRTQALTLAPARTTDAVPVMIGGVLALVMLTVFGAAAAMTKLVR